LLYCILIFFSGTTVSAYIGFNKLGFFAFSNIACRTCKFASVLPWNVCKSGGLSVATPNVKTRVSGESSFKCDCLRTLMDFEGAAASGWVPLIDQVLLTASVFLAYMAGVIPSGRSYSSRKITSSDMLLPASPVFW